MTGKAVATSELHKGLNRMDISTIAEGIYLAKETGYSTAKKIVVCR